jgi:hydroxymethylpyrimidine/phosphomethylpyrimidine kinase
MLETALRELGRHLTVITPNTNELALLTGSPVTTLAEASEAAQALARSAKIAVLVKGGHLGGEQSVDLLCHGGALEQFVAPRTEGDDVHGTGCALSSAIATHLALGLPLVEACRSAKQFVTQRIVNAVRPGRGAPAVV